MICIIRGLKCCTDRLMRTINCVGVPVSAGLIIAKAYAVPKIDELEWGIAVMPAVAITTLNISYYTCCRILLNKSPKNENDSNDLELGPI